VGAGIFAVPGTVAQLLGASSPLAYLTAGAAVLLIALCFAEAGSRFEASGGPYVYVRAAFGNFAGFEVAWLFLLARLTAVAAIANTFASYLSYFFPGAQSGSARVVTITAMIGLLSGSHVFGLRLGVRVNNVLTLAKLAPLVVFCVAGLYLLPWKAIPLAGIAPAPLQQASFLLLFALGGFEQAAIPSEEVIDPKKNVPRAILLSVALVIVLYFLIQIVAVSAMPQLGASNAPLASAAQNFLGPAGALMLTLGATLSTLGSNHVNLLIGPRLLYALSRDGQMPAPLARLHATYGTPHVSILIYGLTAWIFAITNAFAQLAAISALARLLMYASTCVAIPFLRRKSSGAAFTIPGGTLIPLLALAVCIWLALGSSLREAAIAAAAFVVGVGMYALFRRDTVRDE